jgi:hypothetical protein
LNLQNRNKNEYLGNIGKLPFYFEDHRGNFCYKDSTDFIPRLKLVKDDFIQLLSQVKYCLRDRNDNETLRGFQITIRQMYDKYPHIFDYSDLRYRPYMGVTAPEIYDVLEYIYAELKNILAGCNIILYLIDIKSHHLISELSTKQYCFYNNCGWQNYHICPIVKTLNL